MLIKVILLSVTGVFLTVILKKYCKELVPFFEIAVMLVAAYIIFDGVDIDNTGLSKIFSLYSESDELFSCIFKGAAVTVITKLGSDVCRESGNNLMSDIVEFGGRIMLITLSLPYIEKVTEIALSFAK